MPTLEELEADFLASQRAYLQKLFQMELVAERLAASAQQVEAVEERVKGNEESVF